MLEALARCSRREKQRRAGSRVKNSMESWLSAPSPTLPLSPKQVKQLEKE